MKICIFGKFPPIQGGVSMRTFWTAHGLAKLGHTVHVVTNAKETSAPYHMFMREQDWTRVEADYGSGSVKVHWTDLNTRQQAHIPRGTPFVTKLASLGLELAQQQEIDVIFSHYAEPYGVAAHVTSQATGLPHVCRTAGSDAGRLWLLPQFRPLYDHVFRSASAVICGRAVAPKMIEAGVDPSRIVRDHENVRLHDLLTPEGEALDVAVLRDQVLGSRDASIRDLLFGKYDPSLTYFGVYGKLGLAKGTFALVSALKRLTDRGLPVGLLVMAHDGPMVQNTFRKFVADNGLQDRVCQLPFLPHWRVPEFIRRCVAVCCLEQDFPIKFHTPVVAREVLTCGGCLVGSTEVIQKLPAAHKLIDGYNCIAVRDVNNIDDLQQRLASVLQSADRIAQMCQRARRYGIDVEAGNNFPQRLEEILKNVAKGGHPSAGMGTVARHPGVASARSNGQVTHQGNGKDVAVPPGRSRFAYLGMATRMLGLQERLDALIALTKAPLNPRAQQLVRALTMDILMIEMRARMKLQSASDKRKFGTFRLDHSHRFFDEAALGEMVPGAREEYHVVELDFEPDLAAANEPAFGNERDPAELPAPNGRRHYAVIPNDRSDMICVVDDLDLAILRACDGSETVNDVCRDANAGSMSPVGSAEDMRRRLVHLFEIGLIKLQHQDVKAELV